MKMNTLLATVVCCLLITVSAFAQKENNIWYFGDHAGIDFNSGTPVSLSNSAMGQAEQEGVASVSDRTTGSLLFYTDGTTVWDKTHKPMPNGSGLNGHLSSSQSAVIVPMPWDATKYYIFTADAGGKNGKGIHYSIVDMTLNGGLGNIVIATKNIPLLPGAAEKITAVSTCRGDSIWVAAHQMLNNNFCVWSVTNSGVSAVPVISGVGATLLEAGTGDDGYAGCMKFSHDGKKLAMAAYGGIAEVYDFDGATGKVSNPITLPQSAKEYGICFSPDDSRLYVSDNTPGGGTFQSSLTQYNLLAGNSIAIASSGVTIATATAGAGHTGLFATIEVGPDGKIYMARTRVQFLDVITKPNALGTACNYVFQGFSWQGGTGLSWYGLPNVKSFLFIPQINFSFNSSAKCFGDSISFQDSTAITPDFRHWDFGDPSSGAANTSSLQSPKHYYSTPGTYIVTLTLRKDCLVDSLKQTIVVPPPVVANAGQDITICRGDTVQLKATGGSTYYWTPVQGLISNQNISNPLAHPYSTTKYSVKVTNANGCSDTDTVVVTVLPPFAYTASPNPVNLGVTNVGKTKNGTITFTNTSSMNVRIRSFHFSNATFTGTIITSFPTNLSSGNSIDIHFTAVPPSEGVFTGDLCIEVDSACPATVCIPVKIEGIATCLKPNVTTIVGEKPGDITIIPIIVDPSTKFTSAKTIALTIKYNDELLRLIDLTSPVGKVSTTPPSNGEVSCTITVDSTIVTPAATLAEMHVEALLAPYAKGTIDVATSSFTLQSGEQIAGSSCPAEFTLGSDCILQNELKHSSSVSIEGIYPNPSYSKTTIVIVVKNNPYLRLEVYDTFGREVEVLIDGELSDGTHEVIINTEKYGDGIYFCRLIHNGQIATRAFNVVR